MQIYISWSGPASFKIASILRDFIRDVLPGIETWVSSEDIKEGARWSNELVRILDQTSFKIICADPSNHQLNWFNFELGAIAKSTDKWNIKVFLFELKPGDLRGPLSHYQTVRVDKMDVRRLFEDIHANITGVQISKAEMIESINHKWSDFMKGIENVRLEASTTSSDSDVGKSTTAGADSKLEYIDEVDEKILTLLFINQGIDEEKIATTVYLGRGECLKHLIELERKELVWSNLSFGTRRWYVTEKGKKYLPGVYQGYEPEID
jgi:hypothetical protein